MKNETINLKKIFKIIVLTFAVSFGLSACKKSDTEQSQIKPESNLRELRKFMIVSICNLGFYVLFFLVFLINHNQFT